MLPDGRYPDNLAEFTRVLNERLHQWQERQIFDDPKKTAIRSVQRAVTRTRVYLAQQRQAGHGADAPRQDLADLWNDAAVAISEIDRELAQVLLYKAEYWSDPEYWCDQDGLDISIESVDRTVRELLLRAGRPAATRQPKPDMPDLFVSYAREDGTAALAIAEEFRVRGLNVWFDRQRMLAGSSIPREIDAALAASRYGVAILSPHYLAKKWTLRELGGILALELVDGRNRLLPVMHRITPGDITQARPMLGNRLGLSTTEGFAAIASHIADVLANES